MSDMNEKSTSQDTFYLSTRCPMISTDEIAGLVRTIALSRSGGSIGLATLGESIGYDEGRLLAVLELLDRLGLAKLSSGAVELTPIGLRYARTSGQARRLIFADRLSRNIPIVTFLKNRLAEHPRREVHLTEVAVELQGRYPDFNIERGLRQLIDWARYAGLLSYDDRSGVLSLHGQLHAEDEAP